MGPSVHSSDITAAMKSCVFALAFVTLVFSAPMVPEDDFDYDVAYETEFVQTESASDLKNVVAELKKVAPEHLQGHVAHMAEHAELLQDGKAKAYAHDFAKSKKAIEAAIEALNNDLDSGHNHDVAALKTAAADNKNHVANTDAKNKRSVHGVRNKACPTKRARRRPMRRRRPPRAPWTASTTPRSVGSPPHGETWTSRRTLPRWALCSATSGMPLVLSTSPPRSVLTTRGVPTLPSSTSAPRGLVLARARARTATATARHPGSPPRPTAKHEASISAKP